MSLFGVYGSWLLTRTLAPKNGHVTCHMSSSSEFSHKPWSSKAFALQRFRVSESTAFLGFFNGISVVKGCQIFWIIMPSSKHVILMIIIPLTSVTTSLESVKCMLSEGFPSLLLKSLAPHVWATRWVPGCSRTFDVLGRPGANSFGSARDCQSPAATKPAMVKWMLMLWS